MENIKPLILRYKEWFGFGVLFVVVFCFHSCMQSSSSSNSSSTLNKETNPDGIDLLIPQGHTLIPIEIANYETLDSLLGPYGVVDLFFVDPLQPAAGKKIASMVKILRAPKNPSHFAVLVPSSQAQTILRHKGPFTASLQNPKYQTGTKFEKALHQRSRIIYE